MTEFKFLVDDPEGAAKTIQIIDDKFNANTEAQKLVWREIKYLENFGEDAAYKVEFVFPFPNIIPIAWFSLVFTAILSYFFFRWWVFLPTAVLFWAAYTIRYMQSPKYYFSMLKKGMVKNGYEGKIWRL